MRAKVRAIARAVREPPERLRIDHVIHDQAWIEFAKAGAMLGHGRTRNNWVRPAVSGSYGSDWLARSCIDYGDIWSNTQEEAIYYKCAADSQRALLEGCNSYTMSFAKEDLPENFAKYFWSVVAVDAKSMHV